MRRGSMSNFAQILSSRFQMNFDENLGTEISQKLAQRLNIGQFEDKHWVLWSKLRQILDSDLFKTYLGY